MGGRTNLSVAAMLVDPLAANKNQPWARFVCVAHVKALSLELSFTVDEHAIANLIAPRGNYGYGSSFGDRSISFILQETNRDLNRYLKNES